MRNQSSAPLHIEEMSLAPAAFLVGFCSMCCHCLFLLARVFVLVTANLYKLL